MRTNNLKIKTRLLVGFGAILSMVLVLGGVSFWHSATIWDNTDYLYRHPFRVNMAVRDIETNIMAIQRSMKSIALTEDREQLDRIIASINQDEADVYRHFDTIYARYLGKKRTVDSAVAAFREWKPVRDEAVRLDMAGQSPEAVRHIRASGEHHVADILGKMRVLKDFAMARADSFYLSARTGRDILYIQLWLLLFFIVGMSVIITVFVMRGITIPLRSLVNFAEKYGTGNYLIRTDYKGTNELGILSSSMNKMADTVHFEMMVKSGVMQITDAMLVHDNLADFCSSVAGAMMVQTNSNLVAVFLLNDNKTLFEPYFSCGFNHANLHSFSSESNEGEFGRMLAFKKMVTVTQIPDDSIFVYSTVAGDIRPKEIILIPVVRQNSVIAMVTLASIQAYSELSLEIIRQSERNVNMSFNAILAFKQVRDFADSLDRQNEKLSIQGKELQAQTVELSQQNSELETQKQQIDEANRLKSQFLSSMSHELRTPLNSVIALSGVLNRRQKDRIPEEEHGYLGIIERNGKNLLMLINYILDLSRIEAGKMDIHLESVSLFDITQQIISSMQIQIREKQLDVRNLIGPDIPCIMSDSTKCHQILQNLISNAVKFTDTGGVEISARQTGVEIALSVRDTGIGIPADQIPHIFDEFRQVDGSTARRYGGTGLGLAIVDKFAVKLDARVEVESVPGEGSVFTVYFPFELKSPDVTDVPSPGIRARVDSTVMQAGRWEQAASEKTILVVEDSEPAIVQLSWMLREEGYQVEIARSGNEALEKVKVKIPDAIILDLMMPGMDGFDVLERIRGTEESSAVPVLILTAMYLTASDLKRLTQNHIHQFVQKGDINRLELLEIVRQMLFREKIQVQAEATGRKPRLKIASPARILVVDDNEDNGLTLKVLLGDCHDVVVEKDGIGIIAKINSFRPDIIFLDISLPVHDGFTVFDEIRRHHELRGIPVIAVTAKAMKGDREKILAYGFNDYISKPIDPEQFSDTLKEWLM
jgi:signal transduction histidine kinase/DNA-binding response OmpR family regulator/CHASE3 domain sensor protein